MLEQIALAVSTQAQHTRTVQLLDTLPAHTLDPHLRHGINWKPIFNMSKSTMKAVFRAISVLTESA